MLRTHCQTSGVRLQEQDPYNNVVRTAYEAMAAALGGTQSLHTNALDEAIALPTEFSARIARNTQLILQEETGDHQCRRPAGRLLLRREPDGGAGGAAWALIEEVEALGGMTKAVTLGHAQAADRGTAARRQAAVDRGEEVIVGVNKYRLAKEEPTRHPRHRQRQGARGAGGAARRASAPTRDTAACDGGARGARGRRARRRQSARGGRRGGPGARHASARSRTRWRRSSAVTAPR